MLDNVIPAARYDYTEDFIDYDLVTGAWAKPYSETEYNYLIQNEGTH